MTEESAFHNLKIIEYFVHTYSLYMNMQVC